MKRIPAGILAYFVILFNFGFAHAWMSAINRANLQDQFYWVAIIAAVGLILLARRFRPAVDAVLGALAGLLLWAAIGEAGEAGELFENPAIWGVVLVLTIFLTLRPGSRCDFHIWVQKALGIYKAPDESRHWYAPGAAMAFFWTVWLGHMAELTAYYNPNFGVYSWLTWVILIASLVSTPFIFIFLWKTTDWAKAWGRAIPSVLITWMAVEILMKWEILPKPWG
jgi:hypothetical protein